MTEGAGGFPEPIFVGGPGRSGTHPVGRLIGAHPRYHLIRTEARFHAVDGGLPGVLSGEVELEAFVSRLRGPWWKRGFGQRQGLQRLVTREELDAAVADFEAGFAADRWKASRRLARALLDSPAHREGKPAWVEVTGQTIESAPVLVRLFPGAKFINMVRDGRAVVAGMLRKVDMTDDPMRALAKWEQMVRTSDRAMRALPQGRVLVIQLDDLAARDREGSYAGLVEFLEIEDDAPMRRYFEDSISADAAHVGRWRERVAPADARRIDRRYRKLVRQLHEEGVSWVTAPEDGGIRLGPLRIPMPSR